MIIIITIIIIIIIIIICSTLQVKEIVHVIAIHPGICSSDQ